MTVEFRLGDTELMALNGGPLFKFTPAISLFVILEDEAAVDRLWEGLSDGGTTLMPLDKYDWSAKYGWLADRWGLNWQIALGKHADTGRTVTPVAPLRRQGRRPGRGGDRALHRRLPRHHAWTGSCATTAAARTPPARSCTPSSASTARRSWPWTAPRPTPPSTRRSRSSSTATTRPRSTGSGPRSPRCPQAEACGWLKDRFGVSWQIAPRALGAMMTSGDQAAVERVTAAFMKMKKLDLPTLERAFAGAETVTS